MKKLVFSTAFIASLASTAATAQTALVVDPETGNYVPARDPLNSDPNTDLPNPNRLGNRLSPRNARATAPSAGHTAPLPGHADQDDGLTPAQRAASQAAYNGRALSPSGTTSTGQQEAVTSDGFLSLGDMSVYDPAAASSVNDQKPDWWPSSGKGK